jgi:predicted dehydrogenase (TIGR03970 family)
VTGVPVPEQWDVVVVGAGTAGCPLAARLADAGRRVLLLEAGADHARPEDFPPELRDPARMAAAVPGHPANWHLTGALTAELTVDVPRGRVVGGSSALNAGSFIRGTRADFEGWAAAGNDLWSYERVLPAFRRLEADRDFGDQPHHGADGPLPVGRVPSGSPLAGAFAAAAVELGFPEEPDKNADAVPGYGPIPLTTAAGVRVNTAMAYLSPRRGHPGLTVRGHAPVRRVLVERGAAVGVETSDGVVRAAEVVLSAGAVGSAQLLLLSGIGPADDLRTAGIEVVADVLGVGADFTDHPNVYVGYRPARPVPVPTGQLPVDGVLHASSSDGEVPGDLELLPWLTPFSRITGGPTGAHVDELVVGVGLQREDSRGRLALVGADPRLPPRLDYRYLSEESDRRRLREGVRLAAELLRTRALAPLVGERSDLPDDVLCDDRDLDRWIRRHLTTAIHLSGTARMGPASDPGAVVDQELRVRGVAGLRVVDTSVLPQAPSRGPAATAVMLGERAAELMTG